MFVVLFVQLPHGPDNWMDFDEIRFGNPALRYFYFRLVLFVLRDDLRGRVWTWRRFPMASVDVQGQ